MTKILYEIDRMTRRERRNFILSVGGRLGFWEGIKRGGTGLGGLYLPPGKNPWWTHPEFAQVAANPELMKKVLMLRFNNTKRNLAMPVPLTEIEEIRATETVNPESQNKELHIVIRWEGGPDVHLENRGWNNKAILDYFAKPPLSKFLSIGIAEK
jgi:hypothetical protein